MESVENNVMSSSNFKILETMVGMEHEQIVFCQDNQTGLKAIIAIHDTTLGPALGGTRMWNYNDEHEAIKDVLRLSRGMTFKAAVTGLSLGGGKAVIIGDSKTQKTEALMRRFGQFVDSLGGKYITAEDVGMSAEDMKFVKLETDHVTGIPVEMGGGGDPSPVTAYGVYMGIKASAKFKWGSDNLAGRIVVVQGVGHVGENLVKHLTEEGAHVKINDINEENLARVSQMYNAEIIDSKDVYETEMDIYAPCALGATVNDETIPLLNCEIIAGAANNQLEDEVRHSEMLKDKGIVYAPDFLINAGGLINVYSELNGYNRENALNQTKRIFDTTYKILQLAKSENISAHSAALKLAKDNINSINN